MNFGVARAPENHGYPHYSDLTKSSSKVLRYKGEGARTCIIAWLPSCTYRFTCTGFDETRVQPFFSRPIVEIRPTGFIRETVFLRTIVAPVRPPLLPRADADVADDVLAGGVQRGNRAFDYASFAVCQEDQQGRPTQKGNTIVQEKCRMVKP